MQSIRDYQLECTLAHSDIYGQIMILLIAVFLSLAKGLALLAAGHPVLGLAVIALIFLLSLPFLLFAFISILFAFITTLLNHLVLAEWVP